MKIKFFSKYLWLLCFIAKFCYCENQYSLVIKMSGNIYTMLIYIYNQDDIFNSQDIIAKTCFNFIEDRCSIADIANKNNLIACYGIKNLKKQLLEKQSTKHLYLKSIVVGFLENYIYNKQELQKTRSLQQQDFIRNLNYYLHINSFKYDKNIIVVVDNHQLLIQLASEYLYRNSSIRKKLINRFLISSFNTNPQNIEVITIENNKAPTNFIAHYNLTDLENYKDFFFMSISNSIGQSNNRGKVKDKLILIDNYFLGYNIYKIANIANNEIFIIYKSENLIFTNVVDNSYNFTNDYLQRATDISKNNIIFMSNIISKSKLDYTIVIDEFLTNIDFYNIYLQQLKTAINLNKNKIHVVNKEDFYVCLIAAAKTIAKKFRQNLTTDIIHCTPELSTTKKYPIVNKLITNKINHMLDTVDDINDPYIFDINDEQLAFKKTKKLNQTQLYDFSPEFADINLNNDLSIKTGTSAYFNLGFEDDI